MREKITESHGIKVGDHVWWDHDDYYISGVIKYFTDGGDQAGILTDCGKIITFEWTAKLHKKG